MYKLLSYPISRHSTACPGATLLSVEKVHTAGEDCDWTEWKYTLPNHLGTHYDAPNHHFAQGKRIAELPLEQFIFEKPFIAEVPKQPNELITKEDLLPYAEQIAACDALLLRTGFSALYHNPEIYGGQNPGVSSEAAKWLNQNFRDLKAVVLDFISLQAMANIPDGVIAHKWLLGQYSDNMICIIEDANLSGLSNDTLVRIFALPYFIDEIDSAQVTVLAEIKEAVDKEMTE